MERLWEEEIRSGSRVLRERALERLGGAQGIVQGHLDQAMKALSWWRERNLAADAFRSLVSSSGAKIALSAADIQMDVAAKSVTGVERLLEQLQHARILRSVEPLADGRRRYEIFHDLLAEPILAWRRNRERQILIAKSYLAVLVVLITGCLAAYGLYEKGIGDQREVEARGRGLASAAQLNANREPRLLQLSALLAVESLKVLPSVASGAVSQSSFGT